MRSDLVVLLAPVLDDHPGLRQALFQPRDQRVQVAAHGLHSGKRFQAGRQGFEELARALGVVTALKLVTPLCDGASTVRLECSTPSILLPVFSTESPS